MPPTVEIDSVLTCEEGSRGEPDQLRNAQSGAKVVGVEGACLCHSADFALVCGVTLNEFCVCRGSGTGPDSYCNYLLSIQVLRAPSCFRVALASAITVTSLRCATTGGSSRTIGSPQLAVPCFLPTSRQLPSFCHMQLSYQHSLTCRLLIIPLQRGLLTAGQHDVPCT